MGFKRGDNDQPSSPNYKPDIRHFQEWLNRKFASYAGITVDGYYGNDEARVVAEAQRRYLMDITGDADDGFLARASYLPPGPPAGLPARRPRGTLYTCQGTQPSDMWLGPQADVARAVEDLYYWQPIGSDYKAFPMNRYITAAKQGLLSEIEERPVGDPINVIGFSQGAIVVSEVFMEMRDSQHPRRGDWKRAWTFANPSREQGMENGNRYAGLPILGPNKRGIMEDRRRLTNTPAWWMDQGNPADLYFDVETDDEGEDKTAICMIVMGNLYGGDDSIINQVLEVVQRPFWETIAMFKAIYDAGLFFGGGQTPHLTHDVRPAINWLRS
jgi:peptidoglycan hydrolase-like protein with peptidoglycan-binding domain